MFYITANKTIIRKNILNKYLNRFLLENVNVTLNNSLVTLVKGKNGSGKTTFTTILDSNTSRIKFIKINLLKLYSVLQLNNKIYFNLIELQSILKITNNLNNLSYGYLKNYFFKLKWSLVRKYFYFDEAFNGLDKYSILKLNKLFIYITLIGSFRIQISHLNILYKRKNILFLD